MLPYYTLSLLFPERYIYCPPFSASRLLFYFSLAVLFYSTICDPVLIYSFENVALFSGFVGFGRCGVGADDELGGGSGGE